MSAISVIATAATPEAIAAELEHLAHELRSGAFPVEVRRAILVVSGPVGMGEDGVGAIHLGAQSTVLQVVGMLEAAKFNALNDLRSDGE